MKKNLRNVLVLALGLMTTVSFAQDWNVDSRTRVNMHGENDMMLTEQRATIGTTWGGDSWGIHVSTDVNYRLADGTNGMRPLMVYEAYASTDLMGYATMTMGRMAMDYGSGAIIGSNQFGARQTVDAFVFDITNDMLDLTIAKQTGQLDEELETSTDWTLLNASKADGDWSANLLYLTGKDMLAGEEAGEETSMGIDLGYSMMGGSLDLAVSLNTSNDGTDDYDMTSYGATYNVNDNMSVSATQTTYGEKGFGFANFTNMGNGAAIGGDSWLTHGNIGYLDADDQDLAFGVNYDMGGISLGVTMHNISNNAEVAEGADEYERSASEFSLGYSINDNASLSLSKVSDNYGTDDDTDYMYLTISITP